MQTIISTHDVVLRVGRREVAGEAVLIFQLESSEPTLLHWGLCRRRGGRWRQPARSIWPVGTQEVGKEAVQTPFPLVDGVGQVEIQLPSGSSEEELGLTALHFVLYQPESGRWLKVHGRDCSLPLVQPVVGADGFASPAIAAVADEIVQHELERGSWTLMHRFDLCHSLLDQVALQQDGLALLFVWLRFSAVRQLDWQRQYNTKPRELAHAQDRLTGRLTQLYRDEPAARPLVRLMLTTVGRGGDGQRIRDQILEIMHRHKIKEVANHFMEEWHQKLHNNTTPDDIAICAAYLAFLRSDGDLELFYSELERRGVTRARLQGYDRPITTAPDFVPQLKEALTRDFEDYLQTLKSVHEGTDLRIAIDHASAALDHETLGTLHAVVGRRDDTEAPTEALLCSITTARRTVVGLQQHAGDALRELIYLDLALEDHMRVVVERSIHLPLAEAQREQLLALVLENLQLLAEGRELALCARHWALLIDMSEDSREADWPRHAYAVVERLSREVAQQVDRLYQLLQPRAESLGRALRLERWAIDLFSEEVVRGRPDFVLSLLLRKVERSIRRSARLGDWQVISRAQSSGYLEVIDSLSGAQGKAYERPTVLLAAHVAGDEEIPPGVTAVITPDTPDLVSHVAVRARNAGVLFASCYGSEVVTRLSALRGQPLRLDVNSSGDVVYEQGEGVALEAAPRAPLPAAWTLARCESPAFALDASEFTATCVGGKSLNLKRLIDHLPEGVDVPRSIAIPFGVLERTFGCGHNRELAQSYRRLVQRADQIPTDQLGPLLADLRRCVQQLRPPAELLPQLEDTMRAAGIEWPADGELVWRRVTEVWASIWNERACLSRRSRGMPHEALAMAVLIQRIIPADYAFVIHTVNPFNGETAELYAELVVGLGETLVGNYPGRALGFVYSKTAGELELLSYPSKSVALFGEGLIFRSDSSGEDLQDYAGAGLYDSVPLQPLSERLLDYAEERLLWAPDFREQLLREIGRIGVLVEQGFGVPQDIEGVVCGDRYHVVQARPQVGIESEAES